jgi:uncharacterized protein YecE (DUF72 family)
MTVHVGTSGWQYRHWRGGIYPAGVPQARWLERYAQLFSTVESNAAFYRLPERRTFEAWAARTPPDFRMAVKASRYLTHILRLQEPEAPVELLVDHASGLGDKLGPILVQLPPSFEAQPARLEATLAAFPPSWQVSLEVRDASWNRDDVCRILQRYGAALCLADRRGPLEPRWRTADWTYLRFHQGRATPRPCYGDRALETWARRLLEGWGRDAEAWVYFNNDHRGCAPWDALRFAAMCADLGMDVARTAPPDAVEPPG